MKLLILKTIGYSLLFFKAIYDLPAASIAAAQNRLHQTKTEPMFAQSRFKIKSTIYGYIYPRDL